MAKIYYREKLQSRNSEGEKCMSRVWRKPVEASKNSLPVVTQSAQLQQWVVITCAKGCVRAVQLLSRVRLFVTPWITAHQASLSITNSRSSPRLTSIESVMPSSHLILCRPLLLLPLISPSIRVFSNESTLRMRWPEYWSFSFSISPSNEHPGLISFRMDWLDLLAVQTLKSLLQHHSSKASILRCSASSQSKSHIHTWPQEKP